MEGNINGLRGFSAEGEERGGKGLEAEEEGEWTGRGGVKMMRTSCQPDQTRDFSEERQHSLRTNQAIDTEAQEMVYTYYTVTCKLLLRILLLSHVIQLSPS